MSSCTFIKTPVQWLMSTRKWLLFISCCTVTTLLMLSKENIRTSHFLPWFSSHRPHFTHKELTTEDVMFSLQWDRPIVSHWNSVQDSSSAKQSTVSLDRPQSRYCVGENLDVRVEMRDHKGQVKRHGGDFILGRIYSPKLQASASGLVTDHYNGSYRVRFTLFWPGDVQISVLLMHSSEAVQTLWRSRQLNYKKIKHTGTFVSRNKVETSECGFQLNTNQSLCEYKDERDGEYYACYKPASLPCDSIDTMSSANTPGSALTNEEKLLLTRKYIGIMIKNNFSDAHVTNCTVTPYKGLQKCIPGMKSPIPSGYFFGSRWFSSSCKTVNFFDAESINSCLKGKRIYFNGDSTMRQWIQYLNHFQKDFKSLDGTGFSSMIIANHHSNFTIQWKNHGHPWITVRRIKIAESRYISRDLDSIKVEGKEEQVVVVISVGQHFRAFPLELFVRRLLSLRRAIQRLQTRILGTQVFIKLENTREFSSEQERFSDWHGHLQNLAQKKVFGDLNVGFIDAWDMTVAANTFRVHPSEAIVANEMAVFLSYLCHAP